jgi:hypothetical protein
MSQAHRRNLSHVDTVDQNLTSGWPVEAKQELEKGTFAGARVTRKKSYGACLESCSYVSQRFMPVLEALAHLMELYLTHPMT